MQGTIVMMLALSGLGCHHKSCGPAYAPACYSACYSGYAAATACYATSAGLRALLRPATAQCLRRPATAPATAALLRRRRYARRLLRRRLWRRLLRRRLLRRRLLRRRLLRWRRAWLLPVRRLFHHKRRATAATTRSGATAAATAACRGVSYGMPVYGSYTPVMDAGAVPGHGLPGPGDHRAPAAAPAAGPARRHRPRPTPAPDAAPPAAALRRRARPPRRPLRRRRPRRRTRHLSGVGRTTGSSAPTHPCRPAGRGSRASSGGPAVFRAAVPAGPRQTSGCTRRRASARRGLGL